jgi:hypothetical protein
MSVVGWIIGWSVFGFAFFALTYCDGRTVGLEPQT